MKSKDIKVGMAVEVAYGTQGWKTEYHYIDTGCVVVDANSGKEWYSYYRSRPNVVTKVAIQGEDGVLLKGEHGLEFQRSDKWVLVADRNEDNTLSNFRVVTKTRLLPVGTRAEREEAWRKAAQDKNARQREINDEVQAQARFCVEHLPPAVLEQSIGFWLRDALEGTRNYSDGSVSKVNSMAVEKVNAAYVVAHYLLTRTEPDADPDNVAELVEDIEAAKV